MNYNDGFTFKDSTKRLDLWSRSGNDSVHSVSEETKDKPDRSNKPYLEADSCYQWKTLSPSRAENVSLAFKVEEGDVDNGYVLWMWDLAGLFGAKTWNLEFTGVSIEKTMELDGSTANRKGSVDPYFMFPQTSFINNQLLLSLENTGNQNDFDYPLYPESGEPNTSIRTAQHRGKISYSKGRGTFATAATANSLTFQAESLFMGFGNATASYGHTLYSGKSYLDEDDGEGGFSNPVGLYIPLKNIQYDTDYKVTFDISFARQGNYNLDTNGDPAALNKHNFFGYDYSDKTFGSYLANYVDPSQYRVNSSNIAENELFRQGAQLFSSYLMSCNGDKSKNINRTEAAHLEDMGQIKYADKSYDGKPLTKYDEISSLTNLNYTTAQSVNNTYSKDISSSNSSMSRNWFNAVQHTEYNGQNEIHWLTFYNTTFSFNIPEAKNGSINLDDLYWVWAMDSLISGCYYRIKLENVRIEKVVKFTSSLSQNGVMIAGKEINLPDYSVKDPKDQSLGYHEADDKDETTKELNFFRSFRGVNGTGQNWQAKGFVLDEGLHNGVTTYRGQVFTSDGNIYAPIIDATKFNVIGTENKPYQIALNGFAVCQGGVSGYVYSIDGGQTWQDMTFSGDSATPTQLGNASRGVNQWTSGQTSYKYENFATHTDQKVADYTHIDGTYFTDADGVNANFADYRLVVNLEKYKTQANLDIIIAAVPIKDANARCEILRIINFNQIRNYLTFPFDFVSDIKVNGSNGTESPLNVNRLDETGSSSAGHYHNGKVAPEAMGFTFAKTYVLADDSVTGGKKGPSSTTGYARIASNSYDYEDIRTLYSDFPVKTSLGLTGWAIVEGGVEAYYWTADNGKTWVPCNSMDIEKNTATAAADPMTRSLVSAQYKILFYDGVAYNNSKAEDVALKTNHCFRDSIDGKFDGTSTSIETNGEVGSGNMIAADLSKHVGEVVDVIFAAKPIGSDVYVPVGRIDNVAVYGKGETSNPNDKGTFYTSLTSVELQTQNTSDKEARDNYTATYLANDVNDAAFNGRSKWGLNFSNQGYTIFEPYNLNILQTRKYNNSVNGVINGTQVKIDGFISCPEGVNEYKFTLDHGETWINIYQNVDSLTTTQVEEAQISDVALTATENSNFTGSNALTFSLPAQPEECEKDLLVVAESTKGKLYPVLNIRLKINELEETEPAPNTLFAGILNSNAETTIFSFKRKGLSFRFTAAPTDVSRLRNDAKSRLTFPVTETGLYTLSMDAELTFEENANTKVTTTRTGNIYQSWDVKVTQVGTGTVSMSVDRTHFVEGEPINVSYSTSVKGIRTEANAGVLGETVICIARLDDNGNLIRYSNNEVVTTGGNPHYELAQVIVPTTDGIKNGNSQSRSGVVNLRAGLNEPATAIAVGRPSDEIRNQGSYTDLPAGRYRIFFYNDESIRFGNVVQGVIDTTTDLSYGLMLLTDPIDITIHEDTAEVGAIAVHDYYISGIGTEEADSYYNDMNSQIRVNNVESEKRVDNSTHVTSTWTTNTPFTSNTIQLTYNVTEEDVKRGYVIMDFDLSQLDPLAANEPQQYRFWLSNILFVKDGTELPPPYQLEDNVIYFGEYPQTLKNSDVTVHSTPNSKGYYMGSDGAYYAKVVASPADNNIYSFSTGATVTSGTEYYFKVEPIKWRIVAQDDTSFTLICDSILMNSSYDDNSNNYEQSVVREWLNSTFYNTAFDAYSRRFILATSGNNISLPTYSDVMNASYGYVNDALAWNPARQVKVSDYARAKGAWMSTLSGYSGNGLWMLGTPSTMGSAFIYQVSHMGEVDNGGTIVSDQRFGVVPMLKLSKSVS